LLFDVNMFLYIAVAFVIVTHLSLFKTRWGLRVRAVGEHPTAADTVGINVIATRYRNTIYGGIIAGIGGAYLTIGSGIQFSKNISSGKGFIALAAVIFGRWTPLGAVAAAILFGFSDAVQSLFQILAVPIQSNLLLMAPYIATIIAVAGLVGRVRPPAAEGKPYEKQ
jgi:simple sugar transport system permease protein